MIATRRFAFLCLPALVLALAAPSMAQPQAADETFGARGPLVAARHAKGERLAAEPLGADLAGVPEVRLAALDRAKLLAEGAAIGQRTKRLRFGVQRALAADATSGAWRTVTDGRQLWVADFAATGAVAVRLHFRGVALPAGAELAVYPTPAAGRSATPVERRTSASAPSSFWTSTVVGESARVELLLPADAPRRLPFAIDRLLHAYIDPLNVSALDAKAAGSCENDSTCHPEWADAARGVARIAFVTAEGSFLCSGQLMNDSSQDWTPYFLTANHCISDGDAAASTEFFWLYQTAACNGTPPSVNSVPRSEGASLLSTSPSSDYTLLMVTGALPDGLYWEGWTSRSVADGTDAVAIHHPAGDYKRISFGFKSQSQICNQDAGTNSIALTRIAWTDGVTEGGSSGSGILRADTGQLFGQLFFGPSACGAPDADLYDCYGSFTNTYLRTRKLWAGGSDDKSEPNDSCGRARVVRAGTLADRIVKVNDEDWYRMSVPPGRTLHVSLSFANGNGDIDLEGYGRCGGDVVASSTSQDDGEEIALTNGGSRPAFVYWRVYLASSTRNTYQMTTSIE